MPLLRLAMDFSRAGVVKPAGDSYRVHVQWRGNKGKRDIYGPRRTDDQAAEEDLQSMRAAASGMSRKDGFAAMEAQAKQLRDGKVTIEQGAVIIFGDSFAACIKWSDAVAVLRSYGPRRAAKRRAEEDLEALREASSEQADPAARRAALAAEARR